MKHVHGKYFQFNHVSNAEAATLMEQLGYDTSVEVDTEMVNYFRHNTSTYALSEEVVESDAGIFVKVSELPGNATLDENSHTELTEIDFDGESYELRGIFESDDGIYTKMSLIAQAKKELDVEDTEDMVITYEGKDYRIVDTEEEADFIMFVNEDADGEISVVSESDEYSDEIYLANLDEGDKPAFLDNDEDDEDDEGEDKKDKKGKKGKKDKKGKKGKKDKKGKPLGADPEGEKGDPDLAKAVADEKDDKDGKPDFLKGKKFKKGK